MRIRRKPGQFGTRKFQIGTPLLPFCRSLIASFFLLFLLFNPLKPAASPKLRMKSLPQIKRARSPEPFIALSRPGDSPLVPAQNSIDRDALNLPAEKAPAVSAAFLHMVKRLVRAFIDGRPVFNVVREGNTDTQRDFRHRVITLS